MRIDLQASEPQFVDHLAPVYFALPPEHRGDFTAHRIAQQRAREWGIEPTQPSDLSRPVLVASYGDQKRVRTMGRKRIARMEHGAGQSYHADARFGGNASYAGGRDCHDVSLFLVPNLYSGEVWHKAYPNADVALVGCPKLDYLSSKDPTEPQTVAVSFHFDINVIPETRSAFPHYRTALPELAKRYKVIAHAHPKGMQFVARHYARMGLEVVTDFAEVCRRADLYAVDNSSTLFEFASTGRPVVVLNDPGFRKDVNHGGRFWNWADVGIQCDSAVSMVDVVEQAFATDWTARREAVLAEVYPVRSGAAQLAAAALMEWASIPAKAAA